LRRRGHRAEIAALREFLRKPEVRSSPLPLQKCLDSGLSGL
jgi:hypothetical protein